MFFLKFGFYAMGLSVLGFTSISSVSYAEFAPLIAPLHGLDLVSGKNIRVELSQAKKATVLLFLSPKCPCSRSHEGKLSELMREFPAPDFKFVGVHSNADEEVSFAKRHFGSSRLGFPVLSDPKSMIADALGAFKTPHAYVLDPKKNILFRGGVDDSHDASRAKEYYLKNALTAIREGKDVPKRDVRVLGCRINRP